MNKLEKAILRLQDSNTKLKQVQSEIDDNREAYDKLLELTVKTENEIHNAEQLLITAARNTKVKVQP